MRWHTFVKYESLWIGFRLNQISAYVPFQWDCYSSESWCSLKFQVCSVILLLGMFTTFLNLKCCSWLELPNNKTSKIWNENGLFMLRQWFYLLRQWFRIWSFEFEVCGRTDGESLKKIRNRQDPAFDHRCSFLKRGTF